MSIDPHKSLRASPEQIAYAAVSGKGHVYRASATFRNLRHLSAWDYQAVYTSHRNIKLLVNERRRLFT